MWEKSNEHYVITGTAWNLCESDRLWQQQKGRERRAEPVLTNLSNVGKQYLDPTYDPGKAV